ncbi:demethylrebeccamycin-D-glucose O-methyltransferase (plasmid) [Pseudosulfitobacter pseudonitzschiae]|uniref:Demethylrebeccamycin-D-glucose O-methyltransferase n=1 Tax=Pseudosulfitobacter pseudonitzschiae TaxID=1402135 RepID=A0A221K9C0_9RHOB|nr:MULTISPECIES: class I SAM-dependent methyltransferase [Roseobacteraceae]ASM75460.1 demethylrebeccamycin-D-glucose O-methyltransferase [Pseudosulfitobacter pseudonitzschiae]
MTSATDHQIDRIAMYREMQRAIPGLDGMYRLVSALIASLAGKGARLLIAGAGGGREIAALGANAQAFEITAIDPSGDNLETAKQVAEQVGMSGRITFFRGTASDLPSRPCFDIATSLLVMHHLRDDGTKLAYLTALADRLTPGGTLIHADACLGGTGEFEMLIPAYLAHADLVGANPHATRLELEAIPRMPVVPETRMRALFAQAGFGEPREVFRSLWYRCWVSTRTGM